MTCSIGFCIGRKSSELNDIMRKTSKNRKKKGSNAAKFVLRTGGEIDLLGQELLIKLSCKILLTKKVNIVIIK